jgi:large conductance mechanosensitive channel
MSILKEFKEFALRGNVVDLAVGIIIGAAFGKIVASLVGDVLMPPIGQMLGGVNFSNLQFKLGEGESAATIKYGSFIQTVLDFLIVAACVFLLVKGMNTLKKRMERPSLEDPKTKDCPFCALTIPSKAIRCGHCTSQLTA